MSNPLKLKEVVKIYITSQDIDLDYSRKDFKKYYKKSTSALSIYLTNVRLFREECDISQLLRDCRTELNEEIKNGIIKVKDYKTPSKYVLDKRIAEISPIELPRLTLNDRDIEAMSMYILNKDSDFDLTYNEIAEMYNIPYTTFGNRISRIELLRQSSDIRGNLIDARDKINKMIENGEIKLKKEFKTPIYNILYGNEESDDEDCDIRR